MENGILPDGHIAGLFESKQILINKDLAGDQVQPSSLDLRLGSRAWRVKASFLPGSRRVEERIRDFEMHAFSLSGGVVLERNCVYIIELEESLNLSDAVEAVCNAKSSTGRLDVFARVLGDRCVEFDRLPKGYSGPLYLEVCPRSFSVLVEPGHRLAQIRFRRGIQTFLNDKDLMALHQRETLVNGEPRIENGLGFSVDLKRGLNPVGYRARSHTGVLDFGAVGQHDLDDFWEPVFAPKGHIILAPDAFYILSSLEELHIPPECCAEMAPYWPLAGEFRVHYAGFFDPGFGHAAAGGHGSRGVLEVRCHDAPFVLEHGQIVGRLLFERMLESPRRLYGKDMKSNYQGQSLKLSKHFR